MYAIRELYIPDFLKKSCRLILCMSKLVEIISAKRFESQIYNKLKKNILDTLRACKKYVRNYDTKK